MNNKAVGTYALLAIAPVVAVLAVLQFFSGGLMSNFVTLIAAAIGFPMMAFGLYMMFEGSGEKYINGLNWDRYAPEQRRGIVSMTGLFMAVGSIVLMTALFILIGYIVLGFVLIFVSVIVFIVPFILAHKGIIHGFADMPKKRKIASAMVIFAVASVSFIGLGLNDDLSEEVDVEVFDDRFTVEAPMVDKTVRFEEIQEMGYDGNFHKGSRSFGYGTPEISSGTFKNSEFGKYKLAAYTDVKPCIWVKTSSGYFAFNQDSAEKTLELYQEIRMKWDVLYP